MDQLSSMQLLRGHVFPGRSYPSAIATKRWSNVPGEPVIELPGSWQKHGDGEPNETLFAWGKVVGELLRGAPDGKAYKIGAMYIEFENNGGSPVTPPAFDRSGGKSYYDGLSSSGDRDYLRVPIVAAQLDSTDLTNFPDGNRITFFAQTTGVAGVHGKTFSDTVSSRIFGGALVSTPVFSDQTQDIVHSRFYFSSSDNQLVKQAGSQVTMTWPLSLQ